MDNVGENDVLFGILSMLYKIPTKLMIIVSQQIEITTSTRIIQIFFGILYSANSCI